MFGKESRLEAGGTVAGEGAPGGASGNVARGGAGSKPAEQNRMKPLAAIILAAGESRRMGRPKALLACQGTTFLGHLLRVTAHPAISMRRVVLGAAAEEIQRAAGLAPEAVVINPDWQRGQLSSLQAGLRSLPEGGTDGVLV